MRPAYALLLLALVPSLTLALPPAVALDAPPRFDVDVRVTGGDVILQVDLCGHGPGFVDLFGLDLGDPENPPMTLHAATDALACAGDGFRYREVLAEGALSSPLHCYHLAAAFTSPRAQLRESDDDCE